MVALYNIKVIEITREQTMTDDRKINTDLGKTVKIYCYPCNEQVNCF